MNYRYRIIRYLSYDYPGAKPSAMFECQRKNLLFGIFSLPWTKWETMRDNGKPFKTMKYFSQRKAKESMLNYFLRDCAMSRKTGIENLKRYCQYVDFDFIEFCMKDYL